MTWWLWTLLWVLLIVGSLGAFFLVGRSLLRKGTALARELGQASERLSAVAEELQTLRDDAGTPELAVFADPGALRQQRALDRRAHRKGDRRRS